MSQFTFGHALCIGVGAYHDPSVTSVPITVREAEQVAAILQDPAIAAYPPSQVQLLTNAQATKQNIVAALEDLAQRTGTDDTVLIFFSGHGRMGDDGKYVLGVYDTVAASSEQFKAESGLSQDELFHLLRAITAQKLLLIVNACLAGSLSGSLGRSETPEWLGSPPPLPFVNQLLKSGEGRAMITASRPTQPSYFLRAQEYSYFGQALIEGLNGHGITPRGGAIVLLDLYDYIHRQVGAAVKKEAVAQEPMLTCFNVVGSFPIAQFSGAPLHAPNFEAPEPERRVALVENESKGSVIQIVGDHITIIGDVVGRDKIVDGKKEQKIPLLRQKPIQLGFIGVGAVLGLLALSACSGFPSFMGWRADAETLKGAWRLTRVGEVLLAPTSTDFDAATRTAEDTPLWRRAMTDTAWQMIPIGALKQGDYYEAIQEAASGDGKRVYAAARTKGVLVSPDQGTTWTSLQGPLAFAARIAVTSTAPHQIFVSGENGELYRFDEAPAQWTRLDDQATCAPNKAPARSLPRGMQIEWRLVASPGHVFAAPYRDPAPITATTALPKEIGIFHSEDGGACWKLVFDAETRYLITAMANVPEKPNAVLFAALDYLTPSSALGAIACERRTQIQMLDLSVGEPLPLREVEADVRGLYSPDGVIWFGSDNCGQVLKGTLTQAHTAQQGAQIAACRLNPAKCLFNDLADDPLAPGTPLLLVNDRVYRWGPTSWFGALWP